MTGFGRGVVEGEGTVATVEIRSVNSRFAEVSVRTPRVLHERETDIMTIVRQALQRGKINVNIQLEEPASEAIPIQVNEEAARAYRELLEQLREIAAIEEPVTLSHLLQFSEVFTAPEASTEEMSQQAWSVVYEALQRALQAIEAMRLQEGAKLQQDLEGRLATIEQLLDAVEKRAPERVTEAHQKLQERIKSLLADDRLDADRLAMEVALLADRLDITEECVRLRAHIAFFREAFSVQEPVGRRLNFLVQEIHREINTIGSKANDAEIGRTVVRMKEELEKIREQVQNIL